MLYIFKFLFALVILLNIYYPALAEGSDKVNNQQSPLQVIVAIAISAIVLRILYVLKLL